jgi:hypothetical protein
MVYANLPAFISALLVVVICHSSAFSQSSSTVWLTIRDDVGGHDSLVFGTHQFATYCIDTALGEGVAGEYPPGELLAVFKSIPGRENCFGTQGIIRKDLRDFSSVTKTDTFFIDYTSLDSAAQVPYAKSLLRWPDNAYLSERCDSMFLQDREGGLVFSGRIDMFAQSSLIINLPPNIGPNITGPTVRLKIFRYGTHQPYVDGIAYNENKVSIPFALQQNYPNPFNPKTTISFSLPRRSHVSLNVYNLLRMKVRTIIECDELSGSHSFLFDGSSLASGVYYYRLQAGEFLQTRKLLLVR